MYSPKIVAASLSKLESALGRPLKEHTWGEVQDMEARMRDIEWAKDGTPSRNFTSEEEMFVWNEWNMCKISFRYWLERYCRIITDEKRLEPLRPWPSQEVILKRFAEAEEEQEGEAAIKLRAILLKSRQIGGTAFSQGLIGHMTFMNPKTTAIIAADHPDVTLELYKTLDRIYNSMPGWLRPRRDWNTKGNHMRFPEMECAVLYGSGNQKTTMGQGMNVDAVHLTEVSTWIPDMCYTIDADLMPAFDSSRKHHSMMILESTGAGAKGNWFYEQYDAAARGDSQFKPIFIAWYLRPGWSQKADGIEFTESTKLMAARVLRETGVELKREQLAWYQIKRRELETKDQLELFYQEFPSTVEEAFQTGLRSVFSIEQRARIRDGVKKPVKVYDVDLQKQKLIPVDMKKWNVDMDLQKADNRLIIWEPPEPGYLYVVGVDASYGYAGKDSSAVEVLRVGNRWKPDEQVAEWRGTCSPLDLAIPAWLLGHIYTDKLEQLPAKMVVEVNPGSPGIVTQTELLRRAYPHFYVWRKPLRQDGAWTKEVGWWTTASTRPLLTETGVSYIKKGELIINSLGLVDEMSSFVNIPDKRGKRHLEHAPGYHDDRLISLFMALYVAHENDTSMIAEDRRKIQEQRMEPKKKLPEFQESGLSWAEAMERWENSLT